MRLPLWILLLSSLLLADKIVYVSGEYALVDSGTCQSKNRVEVNLATVEDCSAAAAALGIELVLESAIPINTMVDPPGCFVYRAGLLFFNTDPSPVPCGRLGDNCICGALDNTCSCSNGGTAATGNACTSDGANICTACIGDFYLSGVSCVPWSPACTVSQHETQSPSTAADRVCVENDCTAKAGMEEWAGLGCIVEGDANGATITALGAQSAATGYASCAITCPTDNAAFVVVAPECTVVGDAVTGATYTCTTADDSKVSACADGFWKDETGTADVCTECTVVGDAVTGATYTCTTADDSKVSGCSDGFWKDDTGTADVCTACPAEFYLNVDRCEAWAAPCTVDQTQTQAPTNSQDRICEDSCSNQPSPYMIENNKACESWEYMKNVCNKSQDWIANNFCQQSCHDLGLGYTDAWGHDNCPDINGCTNEPSRHMVRKNKSCDSWEKLVFMCNQRLHWRSKKFCQKSCYDLGLGYDGDVC